MKPKNHATIDKISGWTLTLKYLLIVKYMNMKPRQIIEIIENTNIHFLPIHFVVMEYTPKVSNIILMLTRRDYYISWKDVSMD